MIDSTTTDGAIHVQEMVDATPIFRDGGALRARLAQDGFLFFRQLLPRSTVEDVRTDVAGALTGAGWLAPDSTPDCPLPTSAAVREGAAGYFGAYVEIQRLQRFHELAHHVALVDLMGCLIGEPLLVHPLKIARTSLPRDSEYTPPHQDFPLIQGTVDTFTAWAPLGDCPASLGGLRVLVGSHRRGFVVPDPARGPGALQVQVAEDDPAWASVDYRAGDVIVFTSLTVHGALPNTEDRLRFSADFRYQPLREPVGEASLRPHYFPQVPDWDVLTAGWSDRAAVTVPDGVVTAAVLPPLDPTLVAPPSRLLSVA